MVRKELSTAAVVLALISAAVVLSIGGQPAHANANIQAPVRSAASLYAKYCASCHGKDGRSKTFKAKFNHARNLTDADWQGAVSDERIFNSISNSRGKMPAFNKKMSEAEIQTLVLYVRAFKR